MAIELNTPVPIPPMPEGVSGDSFGGRVVNPGLGGDDFANQHQFKQHSFALTHGDGGAKIASGAFIWDVTKLGFTMGSSVVEKVTQPAISSPTVVQPTIEGGAAMDTTIPGTWHQLSAYGDIYIYWEYDDVTRTVDVVDIRVGSSSTLDIPAYDSVTTRSGWVNPGKFQLLIGTVNSGSRVDQELSSDVYWYPTFGDTN